MTHKHRLQGEIAAVVFDLDGTLVDSAADIAAALNHALEAEGMTGIALGEVRRLIGDGVHALVRKAYERAGEPLDDITQARVVAALLAFANADPVGASQLFAGVGALLADLKRSGVKIGVCTNKEHGLAGQVINGVGLTAVVDAFVGGGRYAMKPDPASLLATIAELGVDRESVIYVGDMRVDLLTAIAADVAFLGVDFGLWRADLPDMDRAYVVAGSAGLRRELLAG